MRFTRLGSIAIMVAATAMSLTSAAHAKGGPRAGSAVRGSAKPVTEPDITGVWELYPDPYGGEENTVIELTAPEGGPKLKEPYATKWKERVARREAALKAGTPLADRSTLCLPEGVPLIMGAIFPIQILQNPGQVTVLAEFLTQTRRISAHTERHRAADFAHQLHIRLLNEARREHAQRLAQCSAHIEID